MPRVQTSQVQLIERVADWIDQYNIAELVYDAFAQEFGFEPTIEQCQEIWYHVLDRLGDLVDDAARLSRPDFD